MGGAQFLCHGVQDDDYMKVRSPEEKEWSFKDQETGLMWGPAKLYVRKDNLLKWHNDHLRYEFLRTLDAEGFSELLALKNWCGISLDEAVDRMRKERTSMMSYLKEQTDLTREVMEDALYGRIDK